MPLVSVQLQVVTCDGEVSAVRVFQWDAVPRVGDEVLVAWSRHGAGSAVERVWWEVAEPARVQVDLEQCATHESATVVSEHLRADHWDTSVRT